MSLFVYLKEHLSIVDVVSRYVQIRPAGTYLKGSCPFHSEKDASFTVSPDKQIFYCFGCHASGDVIGFIAKIESLTQREAAQFLIEQHSIQVPQHLIQMLALSAEEKDAKARYFSLCKAVAMWTHKQLMTSKNAYTYLNERNISKQSIITFNLGYFPSGANAINNLLKEISQEGFLLHDLLTYHMLIEGRATHYSPFEERIIFPIKDGMGRNCGFGGRVFKQGDERPKYYNSKESEGFEKGKLLFGLDLAKKAMQTAGTVFLVEGYMDCIMMAQYGYTNTVATLGTACTLDHLKTLSRFIHTLYVVYDGDQAGQKAMLRLTELCWEVNIDVKVITLPTSHDPASFLSSNNSFEPLLANAIDIVTFFINETGGNFSSKPLSQKLASAEKIVSLISRISNPLKQDILLQHTAAMTQLPVASLKDLLLRQDIPRKVIQTEKFTIAPEIPKNDDSGDETEILLLEEKIFSVILNSLKGSSVIAVPCEIKPYFSPKVQSLIKQFDDFVTTDANKSVAAFLDVLATEQKQWVIQIIMRHDVVHTEQTAKQLMTRFCKYHWQRIVKDIKVELAKAKQENDNQKISDVLEQFISLKQGLRRGLI